ncbi:hypothetical protein BDF22DRAFT_48399 [Syncephalis plumigaleata]|nr:hypothetical protein BDF22DRAFT_48399 [Syncephalis plumigaleata]
MAVLEHDASAWSASSASNTANPVIDHTTAEHVPYLLTHKILILIAIVYGLFLLATLLIFLNYRRYSSIQHRCPRMTSACTVANFLLFIWALFHHTGLQEPHCTIQLWLVSVGFPLWVLALAGRLMHMVSVCETTNDISGVDLDGSGELPNLDERTNPVKDCFVLGYSIDKLKFWLLLSKYRRRYRMRQQHQQQQQQHEMRRSSFRRIHSPVDQVSFHGNDSCHGFTKPAMTKMSHDESSFHNQKYRKEDEAQLAHKRMGLPDDIDGPIAMRQRSHTLLSMSITAPRSFWSRYHMAFADSEMLLPVLCIVAMHATVALTLQLCKSYPIILHYDIDDGGKHPYCIEYTPLTYVVIGYIMVLLPIPIYKLIRLRNQYHVVTNVAMAAISGLLLVANVVIVITTTHHQPSAQSWWLGMIYLTSLPIAHYFLVCHIALRAYRELRCGGRWLPMHVHTRSAFEVLLSDRQMLQQFYRFASKDFTAENVLFCCRLRVAQRIDDANQRQQELREIFNMFICPGSRYEVNISCNTRRALMKEFTGERDAHGRIITLPIRVVDDASVFNEAREEVVTLMYQNTYPRYLEHQMQQR